MSPVLAHPGWAGTARSCPLLGVFRKHVLDLSYISQVGAGTPNLATVITLNGADILTLKNINCSTLVADDFVFV